MLTCEIKAKHNWSKLEQIVSQLSASAEQGIKTALTETQEEAIKAKNNVILYPGEIADSEIKVQIIGDGLQGRAYTDGERVLFVEFGTGTEAEMPHIGKTKTFLESKYSFWLLPVEKAPMDFGSDRRVVIGNAEFYLMFPTSPKPFFRTAAFNRRDLNVQAVEKAISELLRGK